MRLFEHKKILLGVTGGIAAYKSAELCRLLLKAGASVQVIMTHSAQAFIRPLTFQALTHKPVYTQLLEGELESGMGHIELARWADLIVIAPATAHCLAQLAHGLAPDLLSTLCLVSTAPLYVAPAMNQQMWHHLATQNNVALLKQRGVKILGPGVGEQACGEWGKGRMLEPLELLEQLICAVNKIDKINKIDKDLHFVITAGPTQEPIDPVRYISNRSSGKMGFALAEVFSQSGYAVSLIHGPVSLSPPLQVRQVCAIQTAQEMYDKVHEVLNDLFRQQKKVIFISVAAVSDFKVKSPSLEKRKKSVALSSLLTLECEENRDILASVSDKSDKSDKLLRRPDYCVGFALETAPKEQALAYAEQKLRHKKLDMIVLNQLQADIAFEQEDNAVTVLCKDTQKQPPIILQKAPKIEIAKQLEAIILKHFEIKSNKRETAC